MNATTRMRGLGTVLAVLTVGGLLFGAGTAASAAPGPKPNLTSSVTAPTNLHVVSESFTDLILAWDASTSSTGEHVWYELLVDNSSYPKYPWETTSMDVDLGPGFGLTGGSTHTFQIEAFSGDAQDFNSDGYAISDKLTVTLGPGDSTAPTAPTNLHVVSMNANGVTLGWDPSSDPDSPDITYFVWSPCGVTTSGTQATIPTDDPVCGIIPPGSQLTVQIFARDPSGNQSPNSNPVTFTYTP